MPAQSDSSSIPSDRLSVQKRADGAIIVRVQSSGDGPQRLPDAVFSFRSGDPQYAYWLRRLDDRPASR